MKLPSNHLSSGSHRKKVRLLSPRHFQQWDLFVEKHPQGKIYHLSGWKKVLEESFSHIKGQILAIWDEQTNEIVAGLPVYYVSSMVTGKRLVSAPFANYCDILAGNARDSMQLTDYLVEMCRHWGPSHIELKTKQNNGYFKNSSFKGSAEYLHHFLPLDRHPDVLFKKFHKKAVQRSILKAVANDLGIRRGENLKHLSAFYRIYSKARKRIGLPAMPYRFFSGLWEVFHDAKRLDVILCTVNGSVIGGSLLLKFKDAVFIEFGHDVYAYRRLCVNHLLDWHAIELAYREGYKTISFGRTSCDNQGLITYKERWGTTTENLFTYVYPGAAHDKSSKKEASWQYRIVRQMCRRSPAPFYNLISAGVYRHLG